MRVIPPRRSRSASCAYKIHVYQPFRIFIVMSTNRTSEGSDLSHFEKKKLSGQDIGALTTISTYLYLGIGRFMQIQIIMTYKTLNTHE